MSKDPVNTVKVRSMKFFLEVLEKTKRIPLERLLKYESALERIALKIKQDPERPSLILLQTLKFHIKSPMLNHSLKRTFGPCLEALFGSDIRNVPPPFKRYKVEDPIDDVPEVLQGEIARLDERFKVIPDPSGANVGATDLICWLDDKNLPIFPPLSVCVPYDYPAKPPKCQLVYENSVTPFLTKVETLLSFAITKLPAKYTFSVLLDTWEMALRQASRPDWPTGGPPSPAAVPVVTSIGAPSNLNPAKPTSDAVSLEFKPEGSQQQPSET